MILSKDTDITGIILAGGKSSRMGEEKGLKLHSGKPFISYIIEAMETITNKILIITKNKDYEVFGYPCISDSYPNLGPVGGIYTGLKNTVTAQNMILSCDIPFITPSILQELVLQNDSDHDVITYENTPLVSLYKSTVLPTFFESIQLNRLSLFRTMATLKVKNIPVRNDMRPFLKNINTQQQYQEAIQWK